MSAPSVIDAGNACASAPGAPGGYSPRAVRSAVYKGYGPGWKYCAPRSTWNTWPSRSTSTLLTLPPIESRASMSTTSRSPSSSQASDTPAIPPPMIPTRRFGEAGQAERRQTCRGRERPQHIAASPGSAVRVRVHIHVHRVAHVTPKRGVSPETIPLAVERGDKSSRCG